MDCQLHVVIYHYVRDLEGSRFPGIKGIRTGDFERQVDVLRDRYEMATLESSLAFLSGRYRPKRDLCLLTFDDGLKDHYTQVTPILAARQIEGQFFLITGCLSERMMAPVHKTHFLMAGVPLGELQTAFRSALDDLSAGTAYPVDPEKAKRQYRFDNPEAAAFKYLLNFVAPPGLRDQALGRIFARYLGPEDELSRDVYVTWDEARAMQSAGMLLGGHTHTHAQPLARMTDDDQVRELERCAALLHEQLRPQHLWSFSYPWGKPDTYSSFTVDLVRRLGFHCGFTTTVGTNKAGDDPYRIIRVDTKDMAGT